MREGELGRSDGITRWGIHHHDPALRGRFDVDVIDADPGSTYDFEQRSCGEHLSADLGFGTHRYRVHVLHQLEHLLW